MKKETIKSIVSTIETDAPNTDILLVTTNKETGIHSLISGDISQIAIALFATLCNSEAPVHANQFYSIIKNVVCNILNNPSPMSNDLSETLKLILEKYGKEK